MPSTAPADQTHCKRQNLLQADTTKARETQPSLPVAEKAQHLHTNACAQPAVLDSSQSPQHTPGSRAGGTRSAGELVLNRGDGPALDLHVDEPGWHAPWQLVQ